MLDVVDSKEAPARRFFAYPKPVEGPKVPFEMVDETNPVLGGIPLVTGAWLSVI